MAPRSRTGTTVDIDSLAGYLQKIMHEQKLTQRRLAAESGLSPGTIANLVNKRYNSVDIDTLKSLARGLQRPEVEIMEIAGILEPAGEAEGGVARSIKSRMDRIALYFSHVPSDKAGAAEGALSALEQYLESLSRTR